MGDGAINALSGGVDSFSVVTAIGPSGAGEKLKDGFRRQCADAGRQPKKVVGIFRKLGIPSISSTRAKGFPTALKGLTDPEEKRQAITDTFYKKVFGKLVKQTGATFLLHGTILTDIEETVAGIKRQHNILAQLGIDPKKAYG
jgi:GMP synthase (glutamine-hydrolysing)